MDGSRRITSIAAPSKSLPPIRLVYVDDRTPGIERRRRGSRFSYHRPDGETIRDAAQLERIARLAIPPAYSNVWICAAPNGHLQATGRDARGRKQYRYHPDWALARGLDKFDRLAEFGAVLPRIRRRIQRDLDLGSRGFPGRATVLAAVVRLLDRTLVRVGNEEYARSNGSFGLTTLRRKHARVEGTRVKLKFPGKSGVLHEVELEDPKVARVVQRCQALEGQVLFHYEDEGGSQHCVDSSDVNAYLRDVSGIDISAKDFRTWHGSVLALALIRRNPEGSAPQIVREVATALRNTAAVCRKSYVHPRVMKACEAAEDLASLLPKRLRGLNDDECHLMALLPRARRRRQSASLPTNSPDVV
jgi:DNA topoisomerase-1